MKEGTATQDTIEFCDRLQYVGIAARDPENHIWGSSPVKCDEGKYHLFSARFKNPFKTSWRSDSHIVLGILIQDEYPIWGTKHPTRWGIISIRATVPTSSCTAW